MLLCVTASTEHCCSEAGRRTRAELLTWSFQNNPLKYVQYACVCACVRAGLLVCAMQHGGSVLEPLTDGLSSGQAPFMTHPPL